MTYIRFCARNWVDGEIPSGESLSTQEGESPVMTSSSSRAGTHATSWGFPDFGFRQWRNSKRSNAGERATIFTLCIHFLICLFSSLLLLLVTYLPLFMLLSCVYLYTAVHIIFCSSVQRVVGLRTLTWWASPFCSLSLSTVVFSHVCENIRSLCVLVAEEGPAFTATIRGAG